jgi:hypothetical protein
VGRPELAEVQSLVLERGDLAVAPPPAGIEDGGGRGPRVIRATQAHQHLGAQL